MRDRYGDGDGMGKRGGGTFYVAVIMTLVEMVVMVSRSVEAVDWVDGVMFGSVIHGSAMYGVVCG